ncbi:MAG: ATP synthase subunit C [Anaerolineae bacterium]
MRVLLGLLIGMVPLLPGVVFVLRHRHAPEKLTRKTVIGFSVVNLIVACAVMGLGLVWFFAPESVRAAGLLQQAVARDPLAYIGAAVSVGLGSLGAAYAVGNVGSAAVGAVAEKPEVFGRALLFVGLAEGVAIYGLIIAFIMLG